MIGKEEIAAKLRRARDKHEAIAIMLDAMNTTVIDRLVFKRTCAAFPEQYDVLLEGGNETFGEGQQVGYVRLRSGLFSVDCPDAAGECVKQISLADHWGQFEDEESRRRYLRCAADAINHWVAWNTYPEPLFPDC